MARDSKGLVTRSDIESRAAQAHFTFVVVCWFVYRQTSTGLLGLLTDCPRYFIIVQREREKEIFLLTDILAGYEYFRRLSSFSSLCLNTVEEEGPRPEEDPSLRVETLMSLQI